jgi:hypothetical protein
MLLFEVVQRQEAEDRQGAEDQHEDRQGHFDFQAEIALQGGTPEMGQKNVADADLLD